MATENRADHKTKGHKVLGFDDLGEADEQNCPKNRLIPPKIPPLDFKRKMAIT